MRRYDFVICYDIADPKRLRKIAKTIEKKAMRIQYSVFFMMHTTQAEVTALLERMTALYHEEQDDIRVYKIKHTGIHMGAAVDLERPLDFFGWEEADG